ncbi:MAG: YraN family protein [Nitriliruptoraceae bacterium]
MDPTTHHRSLSRELVEAVASVGSLGRRGESLAAHHLVTDDALTILARNWRLSSGELRGELDLVAVEPDTAMLVVCEVKTRRDAERFGGAVAAVDHRKQARIRALTAAFLRSDRRRYRGIRLDLVAIDLGRTPRLTHLAGAL